MSASTDNTNPFSDFPSSSSTLHSSTDHAFPTYQAPIPAQHIPNLIPIKLTRDNYLLWKDLFIPVLQTYDIMGMVDGSELCPQQFLLDSEGLATPIENPSFIHWLKKDRTCKIWINAAVSDNILPYTVGSPTARALWLNLEKRFAAIMRSHLLQLKARLQTLKKGSLSMLEYLQLIKHTSDGLAAAGAPLDDIDFIAHTLHGLPSEYDAFSTSVRVRSEPLTPEDLLGLLLSEEIAVEQRTAISLSDTSSHAYYTSNNNTSLPTSRNPSFSSNFRSHNNSPNSSSRTPNQQSFNNSRNSFRSNSFSRPQSHTNTFSTSQIKCQICSRYGHSALTCKNRMNYSYQGPNPPPRLTNSTSTPSTAYIAFPSPPRHDTTSTWYADTGATNHLTNDLSTLSSHSEYQGFDRVAVANGQVPVNGNLKPKDMIKRVFVFSDMEFDEASSSSSWETDYAVIQKKFENQGYGNAVPRIVFWNLRHSKATPVTGTLRICSSSSWIMTGKFNRTWKLPYPAKSIEAGCVGLN